MADDTANGPALLLFWDTTTTGYTLRLRVTPDEGVEPSAVMGIITNGQLENINLGKNDLRDWSYTLLADQKLVGTLILTYTKTTAASARIAATCRNPMGTVHQADYDETYTRTGPAAQPVSVSLS